MRFAGFGGRRGMVWLPGICERATSNTPAGCLRYAGSGYGRSRREPHAQRRCMGHMETESAANWLTIARGVCCGDVKKMAERREG